MKNIQGLNTPAPRPHQLHPNIFNLYKAFYRIGLGKKLDNRADRSNLEKFRNAGGSEIHESFLRHLETLPLEDRFDLNQGSENYRDAFKRWVDRTGTPEQHAQYNYAIAGEASNNPIDYLLREEGDLEELLGREAQKYKEGHDFIRQASYAVPLKDDADSRKAFKTDEHNRNLRDLGESNIDPKEIFTHEEHPYPVTSRPETPMHSPLEGNKKIITSHGGRSGHLYSEDGLIKARFWKAGEGIKPPAMLFPHSVRPEDPDFFRQQELEEEAIAAYEKVEFGADPKTKKAAFDRLKSVLKLDIPEQDLLGINVDSDARFSMGEAGHRTVVKGRTIRFDWRENGNRHFGTWNIPNNERLIDHGDNFISCYPDAVQEMHPHLKSLTPVDMIEPLTQQRSGVNPHDLVGTGRKNRTPMTTVEFTPRAEVSNAELIEKGMNVFYIRNEKNFQKFQKQKFTKNKRLVAGAIGVGAVLFPAVAGAAVAGGAAATGQGSPGVAAGVLGGVAVLGAAAYGYSKLSGATKGKISSSIGNLVSKIPSLRVAGLETTSGFIESELALTTRGLAGSISSVINDFGLNRRQLEGGGFLNTRWGKEWTAKGVKGFVAPGKDGWKRVDGKKELYESWEKHITGDKSPFGKLRNLAYKSLGGKDSSANRWLARMGGFSTLLPAGIALYFAAKDAKKGYEENGILGGVLGAVKGYATSAITNRIIGSALMNPVKGVAAAAVLGGVAYTAHKVFDVRTQGNVYMQSKKESTSWMRAPGLTIASSTVATMRQRAISAIENSKYSSMKSLGSEAYMITAPRSRYASNTMMGNTSPMMSY